MFLSKVIFNYFFQLQFRSFPNIFTTSRVTRENKRLEWNKWKLLFQVQVQKWNVLSARPLLTEWFYQNLFCFSPWFVQENNVRSSFGTFRCMLLSACDNAVYSLTIWMCKERTKTKCAGFYYFFLWFGFFLVLYFE